MTEEVVYQVPKFDVWVLSPAGFINSTTEDQSVQLITSSPTDYANYVFFFAELAPPEEIEE